MPALLQHSPFARTKPPAGSQVDWGHPLARGLIGAWGLTNNLDSAVIADVSQGPYGPMTVSGTVTMTGGRFGSNAPYFSTGTPFYATVGAVALPGSYSWLIWFKADSVPAAAGPFQPLLMATRSTTGFSWSHGTAGFRQAVFHEDAAGTFTAAKIVTTLAAQVWYQIVATFDGSTLATYLNGTREATAAALVGNATAGKMDMQKGGGGSEIGVIDHICVWKNRALTPNEVLQLYNEPFAMLRGPDVFRRMR